MSALHQPGDCIQERYEIVHTIGQGGGGTTYEAKDLHRDRSVAIKSLSLKQIQDWKTLELLEREANVLAELDHPSIPQYLDHFTIDTAEDYSFYLVQELAPGKSIATLVENGWQPTEKIVKDIAHQVLQVLDYLHSQVPPILHRDIKPENLIYTKTGKIYLVDFGAVQAVYRQTIAANSTLVGTFGYMPLEQINGKAQPASDLYALGASLVYLLTHCSPSELPQKHLKIEFRQSTVTSVSKQFANWLEKMLEPDVDNRFQSAKEALESLNKSETRKSFVSYLKTSTLGKTLIFSLVMVLIPLVGASIENWWSTWLNFDSQEKSQPTSPTTYSNKNRQDSSSPNFSNRSTSKHLLYAAKSGNLEMVERSLSNGANVNQADEKGRTPLYLAARYGYPEIVSRLLAAGAQVDSQTYDNGKTPLYIASGYGNLAVVKQLLAAGAQVSEKKENGFRTLHNAAYYGHLHVVKQLLAAGAQVNAKTNNYETPLHIAAKRGKFSVVEQLLKEGARVNVKNNESLTPLALAKDDHIRELLKRNGAKLDAANANSLLYAAKSGNLEMVERSLSNGANVNQADEKGRTPLYLAARYGYPEIVSRLLAAGAQVDSQTYDNGKTPLYIASGYGNLAVVKQLLAAGAQVSEKKENGFRTLHNAAYYGHLHVVKQLLAAGAQVNAKTNNYETPLHIAAKRGKFSVVEQLLKEGARVNVKNNESLTPLALAKDDHIRELLKRNGAKF